jgi:hypothetical protein
MEQIQTHESNDDLSMRELVISGLAMAVPEFLSRAQAAEQMKKWFPADELAVRALHRRITMTAEPMVA